MNRIILAIFFLVLSIIGTSQVTDFDYIDKIAENKSRHELLKSSFVESQNYSETDFIYQRMEWEVDPSVRYISGKITSYFKSKTDNLNEVEFDLYYNMNVDSIFHGGNKINHSHMGNKLNIPLETSLNTGDIDSVEIYYQGTPTTSSGFGTFTTNTHEGTPALWTLSEPYGVREWWPCKQSLVDKIDSIDIIVTTPHHSTSRQKIR